MFLSHFCFIFVEFSVLAPSLDKIEKCFLTVQCVLAYEAIDTKCIFYLPREGAMTGNFLKTAKTQLFNLLFDLVLYG